MATPAPGPDPDPDPGPDLVRDLPEDTLREALPLKWGSVEPGVLPAFVAEMDYALAEPVTEAVVAAVRRGATGYPAADDRAVGEAFAGWSTRHWGHPVDPAACVVTGDVIAGIRLALEVLCPPGPVVVPLPCYPPFRDVVALAGREVVAVTTDPDAAGQDAAALDLDAVERAFAGGARTLLLCNPHNPLGRVPRRSELEDLAALAARHGARVVSDEIHGPLVLPGSPAFTPYAAVDARAITVTSASKTFNTAGLHCAVVVAPDPAEQAALRGVPVPQNHAYSPLGMVAAEAAWSEGDAWHAALVARLGRQRDLHEQLLASHLPRARSRRLEATYLPWLDLRGYGHDDPAAVARPHGVAPAPGHVYEPGLAGHVRLNVATTPQRLTTMVERLAAALG